MFYLYKEHKNSYRYYITRINQLAIKDVTKRRGYCAKCKAIQDKTRKTKKGGAYVFKDFTLPYTDEQLSKGLETITTISNFISIIQADMKRELTTMSVSINIPSLEQVKNAAKSGDYYFSYTING